MKTLGDCLWYIDGHHDALIQQSCPIPSVFRIFQGFNRPEASKHRKHKLINLECAKLKSLASMLFELLLLTIWYKELCCTFKSEVQQLATSVQRYADYLVQKNKQMKLVHANPTPVRTISENMTVKLLRTSSITNAPYTELSLALSRMSPYQLLPVDPLDKKTLRVL